MDYLSKNKPNASKIHAAFKESYVQLKGRPCIHAEKTLWQSGVQSCILPVLRTHSLQEINVDTVANSEGENSVRYRHLFLNQSTGRLPVPGRTKAR